MEPNAMKSALPGSPSENARYRVTMDNTESTACRLRSCAGLSESLRPVSISVRATAPISSKGHAANRPATGASQRKPENQASAEFVLQRRAELQQKLDARRAQGRELAAAWLATGNRPKPVSTEGLEVRLRLDEGQGDVVRNSAPNAQIAEFKAEERVSI